ncbi:MAG: hypothetical protein OHK0019_07420 [Saprospiraceae bacterium]
MSEKDEANLLAMKDAAEKILRYSKGFNSADDFYGDAKSFDATLMNFLVIGKTVSKISEPVISANPKIAWSKIKGLRNIVAHDYFGVDAEEIWEIIQKNIPKFITDLEEILTKKSG